MTKKQFRARLRLLIVLSLVLLGMIGFASGKYVQDVSFNGTVTFTASLAKKVILQEHEAVPKGDGSYELGSNVVKANTYYLIPGLDIPKDPHIVITGKTPIEAYLFVEVVDNTGNAALTYQLRDNWIESTLQTSKYGGKIYVYSTDKTNPAPIASDLTAYILEGDKIAVSQKLLSGTTNDTLTFYAYLVETTGFSNS